MAPSYRNQNRRQNRTVDHDVFEGLPVRHWRRDFVTVAPPVVQENNASKNDMWAVELPHGMPKDYHLLPQHSQDLLRAARSGRIYKRPAPVEDDEVDAEAGEKPDKKEEDPKDKGFSAKAWKQVPRHLEGPDVEYLAKRRKGVITAGAKAARAIPTVTKATVKRVDAAGNEYVQDVVVPHGQPIEGELLSQTEIPDPNAAIPGGLLVQPTPPKRKSSSRKKLKSSARGRKKKHSAPTSVPVAGPLEGVVAPPVESQPAVEGQDVVKIENDGTTQATQNEDTEMHDGSAAPSDNDDSEEGEEEEGDEEEGSIDEHASPSKAPSQDSTRRHSHIADENVTDLPVVDTTSDGADLPVSTVKEDSFGSPLKNVVMASSALASPLEAAPDVSLAAPIEAAPATEPEQDVTEQLAEIEEKMQEEVTDVAPAILPPVPPKPTIVEVEAAVEERRAEEEEEAMLLDIVDSADAHLAQPVDSELDPQSVPEVVASVPEPEPVSTAAEPVAEVAQPLEVEALPTPIDQPPVVQAEAAPSQDTEDDFPDLLGGLEKSLEKPIAATLPVEEPAAEAAAVDPTPDAGVPEPAPATEAVKEEPAPTESAPTESAPTEEPTEEPVKGE